MLCLVAVHPAAPLLTGGSSWGPQPRAPARDWVELQPVSSLTFSEQQRLAGERRTSSKGMSIMARRVSGKLGGCLVICFFSFLPPNCPRECSSSGGSHSLTHTGAAGLARGVFRSQPCCGDEKTQVFWQNPSGLHWFVPCLSLPLQPSCHFSPHTGAVPSIPRHPACAPTHQRAPGWPPAPRPGRGGPGLLLAPPAWPCRNRCWL